MKFVADGAGVEFERFADVPVAKFVVVFQVDEFAVGGGEFFDEDF